MRPLSEVSGQELLWVQPAARKKAHELRAAEEVVATLIFQRGSLADAVAADQHWTFKREGFWHPRVTVRTAGSDADLAIFRPRWMGGGTLELGEGKTADLSPANLWQSQWVWKEGETPLLTFRSRHGLIKAGAQVEIAPASAQRKDLALLVLLGYYLILLYAEDAVAASTAATVAATSA